MAGKHDRMVRELGLKPGLIGLEDIVYSATEGHLLLPNGGLLGEPDNLMFDPTTQTIYNVEYKCYNSNKNADKARYQLKRNSSVLQSVFEEWRIVNLYVSEDYEVEEL